jgi:hypothetical protein
VIEVHGEPARRSGAGDRMAKVCIRKRCATCPGPKLALHNSRTSRSSRLGALVSSLSGFSWLLVGCVWPAEPGASSTAAPSRVVFA